MNDSVDQPAWCVDEGTRIGRMRMQGCRGSGVGRPASYIQRVIEIGARAAGRQLCSANPKSA
jgi:hypothetical protein